MTEKIIGRQKEIKQLQKCMDANQAQLIIVYGRRRVGKTFLINNFFNGRFDFKVAGSYAQTKEVQLKNFITEYDIDLKDIRLMWQCFKKQNINYLEILFTEFFYIPYDYYLDWMDMTARREDIAHMDNYLAINCIVGMILEKNAALCHPYPTLKDKIDKYGYDNKQLHHILRCQEFLDRYIAGVSYADCLISQNPKYLTEIKATYKFDLDTAKALAKDTVEYAKFVKKNYLETHEHVTNTKMSEEIDSIMVSILSRYWRDMC